MRHSLLASALLTLGLAPTAHALQLSDLSVGGGLGVNSLSGYDDALGFQVFVGVPLALDTGLFIPTIEVGYLDTGSFDTPSCAVGSCRSSSASGAWATLLAAVPLNSQFGLLGRAGFDFGDDDGAMVGAGLSYTLDARNQLRAEYVSRDNIDSYQLNYSYNLK